MVVALWRRSSTGVSNTAWGILDLCSINTTYCSNKQKRNSNLFHRIASTALLDAPAAVGCRDQQRCGSHAELGPAPAESQGFRTLTNQERDTDLAEEAAVASWAAHRSDPLPKLSASQSRAPHGARYPACTIARQLSITLHPIPFTSRNKVSKCEEGCSRTTVSAVACAGLRVLIDFGQRRRRLVPSCKRGRDRVLAGAQPGK